MRKIILTCILVLLFSTIALGYDHYHYGYRGMNNPDLLEVECKCSKKVFKNEDFIFKIIISEIDKSVKDLRLKEKNTEFVESYTFDKFGDKYILEAKMNYKYTGPKMLLPWDLEYKKKGEWKTYRLRRVFIEVKDHVYIIPKTWEGEATLGGRVTYRCLLKIDKNFSVKKIQDNLPKEFKVVDQRFERKETDLFNIVKISLYLKCKKPGSYEFIPFKIRTEKKTYSAFPFSVRIAPVRVTIELSKEAVLVGQPFTVKFHIRGVDGVKIEKKGLLDRLSLLPFEIMDKSITEERKEIILEVKARAFMKGGKEYRIGGISIVYGNSSQIKSPEFPVRVNSVLSSRSSSFKGMKFLNIKVRRWKMLNIYLPIGIAIILSMLLFFLIIQEYRGVESEPDIIPGKSLEDAKEDMKDLINRFEEKEKVSYAEVYDTVREFLGIALGYEYPKSKTLRDLEKEMEDKEFQEQINNVMIEARRAKFDYDFDPGISSNTMIQTLKEIIRKFD